MSEFGNIFLTGGSGSFGRAFIRYVLKHDLADRVVSMSRNSEMRYRLEADIADQRLVVVPGEVRILGDVLDAFVAADGGIDTVVHAAAEKHIGTGERFERWVRSINEGGLRNVLTAAWGDRVKRFVSLSTDKACAPVNVYGRSKALAEQIAVSASASQLRVSVVRYGNVVGSSGSVIPLFVQQRTSNRVTITDRRMTRFFMALSPDAPLQVHIEDARVMSAVELVCYALRHMHGGEIFVPQIPSATIENLAEQIAPGCAIEEIGIRPGEKLHEALIDASESGRCSQTADGVYVIHQQARRSGNDTAEWRAMPSGWSYSSDQNPLRLTFTESVPC